MDVRLGGMCCTLCLKLIEDCDCITSFKYEEDKFICDGCGEEYPIGEFGVDINTSNLAGIVMCKKCIDGE